MPGASTPTGAHNPTCKEPVHPPPLSPCHPHGQVRLHSRRGRRHVGEEGARAHPRATPQDGQGAQGGMGGVVDATSLLRQACCLRPFPARESAVSVTHRAPHGRASPKPSSPPPSGARSRPPQGLWREAGRVGTSRAHGGGGGGCGVCGRRAAARLCGRGGRGGRAAPQPRRLAAAGVSRAKRCATAVRLRTGARLRGGQAGQRGAEITRIALKGPRPEPPARHPGGGPGSPAARRQTGQESPPPTQSDPPTLPFK